MKNKYDGFLYLVGFVVIIAACSGFYLIGYDAAEKRQKECDYVPAKIEAYNKGYDAGLNRGMQKDNYTGGFGGRGAEMFNLVIEIEKKAYELEIKDY